MWVPEASQSNYATAYSCSLTIIWLMNTILTQEITCPIKNSAYAFLFLLIWFSSWRYLCLDRDICAWTEGADWKRKKIAALSDLGTPFGTPRQNAVWVKLAHVLHSDHKFPSEQMHCPCSLFLFNKMTTTYCSEVQRVVDTLPSWQVCFTLSPHNP